MGRRPRNDFAGATHHVMNRGVDRARIFFGDADRVEFGRRLAEIHDRFGVEVVAYCLMPNHYHLLVHTPTGDLSKAMHHLSLTYTRHTNDRLGRDGPLFRGRYHSIVVSTDAYLACAARYIHRNPLALSGVEHPADYRWSSYRALLGFRSAPPFLNSTMIVGAGRADIDEFARFTESLDPIGPPIDLKTALLLADLAQSAADTEPQEGAAPVTRRLVLTLMADMTDCPRLRDTILRHLEFPTDAARRAALHRARRLTDHPVVHAVINQLPLVSDTRGNAGRAA
jgi:REP element-mobilizing transposase RayT